VTGAAQQAMAKHPVGSQPVHFPFKKQTVSIYVSLITISWHEHSEAKAKTHVKSSAALYGFLYGVGNLK
jgi:hypothetical protein